MDASAIPVSTAPLAAIIPHPPGTSKGNDELINTTPAKIKLATRKGTIRNLFLIWVAVFFLSIMLVLFLFRIIMVLGN